MPFEDYDSRSTPPAADPSRHEAGAINAGMLKPRVKPASLTSEGTPAGASFTRPTPAPLPERGAGIFLFLSLIGATVAVVFLILVVYKL
jgi:hypothetical protein